MFHILGTKVIKNKKKGFHKVQLEPNPHLMQKKQPEK